MKHRSIYPFVVLVLILSLFFIPATPGVTRAEAQSAGINLIANGDFEAGNAGFITGYKFSPQNIYPESTYDVLTNPRNAHPSATSYGDHTSKTGKMLALNGASKSGVVVWSQTVIVDPNSSYTFSAWISTWSPGPPAQLVFKINGVSIGAYAAPETPGTWMQFSADWNSGNSTSASIQIVDTYLAVTGNDFAIDDLVLEPANGPLICAPNLTMNGDFTLGNTGFSTGYKLSPNNIYPEGTYDVLTNPRSGHPAAASFGDHTTGTGNMLALNGSPRAGTIVWTQQLPVKSGTNYLFSAWVSSWSPGSMAQLQFKINGVLIGTFTAPSTTAIWVPFTANWNSGTQTAATIQIVNTNLAITGNDFALDDIALRNQDDLISGCPTPPTVTTVPPTVTTVPPTVTTVPPTETTVPPTVTTVPPTETTVPPTVTTVPPTVTTTPPTEVTPPPPTEETPTPPTPPTEVTPPPPTETPTETPSPICNQGCTPGYWKQEQHLDSWDPTGFSPEQDLESVFDVPDTLKLDDATLLQALSFRGGSDRHGAAEILLRAGVSALLNSAQPDVGYPLTTAQVIDAVNHALASGNRSTMLNLAARLDKYNNLGCPLN